MVYLINIKITIKRKKGYYAEKPFKRLTALFIALTMIMSFMPTIAVSAAVTETEPGTSNGVYQIGTAGELLWFSNYVNSSDASISAVLTGDIDLSDITAWTPIGTEATPFTGTFDGNGKTISNMSITASANHQGLFGYVSGGGTVKNFTISGSISCSTTDIAGIGGAAGYAANGAVLSGINSAVNITNTSGTVVKHIGGIVGGATVGTEATPTTVDKCIFSGSIDISDTTDCISGVVGYANQYVKITNSANIGSVTAQKEGAYIGGILAYINNANFSGLENCYNYGTVKGSGSYVGAIVGRAKDATASTKMLNNYYLSGSATSAFGTGSNSGTATSKTAEEFASGQVCYLLNKGVTDGTQAWYQTLNSDNKPVVDKHSTVYGGYNGTCYLNYSNDSAITSTSSADHSYGDDGVCTVCKKAYISATDNNGVYEIGNAGQLLWFAEQVNTVDNTINGRLTDNIDMGDYSFISIGTGANPYSGTFDGQGYTITVNQKNSTDIAPFGCIGNCTIKNLKVTGTINTSVKYAAGIAMQNVSGTTVNIENCISDVKIVSAVSGDGTHGGLIGVVNGTANINNCAFTGSMTGSSTDSCGGLVGWTAGSATISNSYISADLLGISSSSGNTFSRNPGNVTLTNCYYLNALNETPSGAIQVTADQLASGEVCYKLNGDQSNINWYQTIGTDKTPQFSGSVVYYGESKTPQYYNGLEANENGVYEIASYDDLVLFQNGIDDGTIPLNANAVLTADIVANTNLVNTDGTLNSANAKYKWTPICKNVSSSNSYNGTFDGQGYTISGLYTNETSDYNALFAQANGTIKNLGITDSYFNSTRYYSATFIGYDYSGTVVENCWSDAVVKGQYYCGGICGITHGQITNCYYIGKITAGNYSNAIASDYSASGTLTNCYYLDTCGLISTRATSVTADQLASGELCYNLNGDQSNIVWYQNVDKGEQDNQPVLDSTHNIIYGGYNNSCVANVFTNDFTKIGTPIDHTYNNGICSLCGVYEPVTKVDDKNYEIGSYGQLVNFQRGIDDGTIPLNANAVLTADIVANENLVNTDGTLNTVNAKYQWTPICKKASSSSKLYSGTFDGQGHTISGLYTNETIDFNGLFAKAKGTIQNLGITDSYFNSTKSRSASFIGSGDSGSKIENCWSDAVVKGDVYCGGICGRTYGQITNCYYSGKITADITYSNAIASDYYGYGTLTNCYYLDTCGLTSDRATVVTADQLASGEVCYKLNNGVTDGTQAWYQTIGADSTPQFSGKTIYYNANAEKAYFNVISTGDVDNSGTADKVDAALVLKHISGIATLTQAQLNLADLNNDGKVDMLDVVAILNTDKTA